ncbi:hypothetical protein IFM89_021896 [Coptis chinensis]|uniref:Transposase MuDR plant domain-containing protein n=1 Tax=Coptis chinensis TaxID=261450 RepID=A0A835HDE5_9MAGN|nr:hypothetical protein IFM89_021896 [Coptis chinensis]
MWFGKRKFVVHLGGLWKDVTPGLICLADYSAGLRRILTLEDDELNWIDFIKKVQMFVPRKKVSSVQCILAGHLCVLGTDQQLMLMWENIMVESDYRFHLFVSYDHQIVQGTTDNWEKDSRIMGIVPTHDSNPMPTPQSNPMPTPQSNPIPTPQSNPMHSSQSNPMLTPQSNPMHTFQFNPMSSPDSNLMHSPDSSPVNIFDLTKPINESTLDDYVDLTKEIPKKPKRKRKPYKKKRCNVKDFESQSEDEYIVEPTMDPHLESTGEAYVIDIDDETIHVEEEIEFQSQSEDTHDIGANDVDVDKVIDVYREITFEHDIVDNDGGCNIFHNDVMDDATDDEQDRCFDMSNGVGPYMTQETCYVSEKESDEEDEDWDYDEEEASDDDISKLELVSEGEMDVDIQIDEFVKSTRNLYEVEDNERIEDPALGTTNFSLTKGMTWRTILECRKFMKDMAIAQKFSFKQKKNDKTRYKLVCKDPECKWFVNCSRKVDGHTLKLRLFNPTHTCEGDKNNKNVQAKAPWVANELEDFARAHPTFAPKRLA